MANKKVADTEKAGDTVKAADTVQVEEIKTSDSGAAETVEKSEVTETPETETPANTETIETDETTELGETEIEKLPEPPVPPSDEDEPIVKSGFERVSIRAVCPNGSAFTGSYGSIHFDDNGETQISVADRNSLEDLQDQFPALEIKQT